MTNRKRQKQKYSKEDKEKIQGLLVALEDADIGLEEAEREHLSIVTQLEDYGIPDPYNPPESVMDTI